MTPYRIFISYSSEDRQLVEELAETLKRAGLTPIWDKHLVPGTGFSESIQRFITNCHVFMPLITPSSTSRPWVHHEIGFARALGKPMLPVTVGPPPSGMIQEIQAVRLRDDLGDAPTMLTAEFFCRFWDSVPHRPPSYECAEDNLHRAQLLAQYADSVWAVSGHGMVRQMASLTTFHLPGQGPDDPVWRKFYPAAPDSRSLYDALRRENVALLRHARESGCRLILDPVESLEGIYRKFGPGNLRYRLEALLDFLRDDPIKDLVVAVNDKDGRIASLTLVGDWFSSEAVPSGGTRVLREALFTRDLPTIELQIKYFDSRMGKLLESRGWDEASSRQDAARYLADYLENL